MWPNLQFPADLVTFTEEVLNGKFIFFVAWLWKFVLLFHLNKIFSSHSFLSDLIRYFHKDRFPCRKEYLALTLYWFPNVSYNIYYISILLFFYFYYYYYIFILFYYYITIILLYCNIYTYSESCQKCKIFKTWS